MKIGRHVSLSTGAAEVAAYGLEAIQVFTKNPRTYFATNLAEPLEFGDLYVVAHAGYLVHLKHGAGSDSAQSLLHEALRCAVIGIPDLVCHTSSDLIQVQADCVNSVVDRWPMQVRLLIENNCRDSWQLTCRVADALNIPHGVCFDTAHAWGAGLPSEHWPLDADLYHVNDSVEAFGSRRDRHANLGTGTIPVDAFRILKGVTVPMIMETPTAADLPTLRSLICE